MARESQSEAELKLVRAHVNQLHEHFDTVQIFCTKANPDKEGGTININFGAGDWFARYGKVRQWLITSEEGFRIDARNDQQED